MKEGLVVFGRQPIPGKVKTRLAEGIGAEMAAAVYRDLLEHTLETVRRAGVPMTISLAEEPDDQWAAMLDHPFETQVEGGLGPRMAGSFERRFAEGATKVVLIGSDNAHLRQDHIHEALKALDPHQVVLGPADDGGYWLVGQRRPGVDLFSSVPWSDPTTLEVTRQRLETLDVDWIELESLPDIDTADDLRRAIHDPRVDEGLRRRLEESVNDRGRG